MHHHSWQITGAYHRDITIPATHQKYTCTMKENTSFLSSQRWRLVGWKALGSHWGLSTCRKKVGLLSNAQLIKLWCVPSPCRSMHFFPHLQPPNALPARPITLKHVFVLSRLTECVFFLIIGQHSSQQVTSSLSRRGSGQQRNSSNAVGIAQMDFTCVCNFRRLAAKVSRRSSGSESVCYIQSTEQSWDADGARACHV